eukprot:CAMPEP_0173137576 /NCGR_PEP_ID=MMETSP1105-20130129/3167_1 /TAXON_ID=2985 /ORGANISM="Ochromonas sp., Strain BG-1" /LENGTH=266 /DNA_ID=CAMNT_0014049987 /DNA_START=125 /DNA_END=925 /DNA_ORIENTATION=+
MNRFSLQGNTFMKETVIQQDEQEKVQTSLRNGPIPPKERVYLINGWRWHTLSVIEDLRRFIEVIKTASAKSPEEMEETMKKIQGCYQFIFKFNWSALINVERRVFFPWLEDVLPAVAKAYVKKISSIHDKIELHGEKLASQLTLIFNEQELNPEVSSDVIGTLEQMIECAEQIQSIQEEVLVPLISSHISKKDQERFNRKVINGLGIINSQVHLVSMYEAVKNNPKEFAEFQKQIPKIAQYTIPYWKRYLYDPRANALDIHLSKSS